MKKIEIDGEKIEYKFRKSKRAKCLRLTVNQRAELVVTAPSIVPMFFVNRFIRQKSSWILKSLKAMKTRVENENKIKSQYGGYAKSKEKARDFALERVKYFAGKYGFTYNRIAIRNQKSRWGSCSAKNNLNFNYRLLFLETELSDYVIVHELCHLREMNHSQKFWKQVEDIIPDWRLRRHKLKKVVF